MKSGPVTGVLYADRQPRIVLGGFRGFRGYFYPYARSVKKYSLSAYELKPTHETHETHRRGFA